MEDIIIPAKTVVKIMEEFELSDSQFANLFGVSLRTVIYWRENGVAGKRGNTPALFDKNLSGLLIISQQKAFEFW